MPETSRAIDLADLPELITGYLEAHRSRAVDTALASYTADATVTDEGKTYTGAGEIRRWLSRSASEYTYTIAMTGATMLDENRYDITQHLEGNFPGGEVDLHFRFTLWDGKVARLVIEP